MLSQSMITQIKQLVYVIYNDYLKFESILVTFVLESVSGFFFQILYDQLILYCQVLILYLKIQDENTVILMLEDYGKEVHMGISLTLYLLHSSQCRQVK